MKILLMGGTGALGAALAPVLTADTSNSVYITSRKKHDDKGNIHYILCNAKETDELVLLLQKEQFDVVVDFMLYSEGEFENVAKKVLPLTRHYVFLSSARVYAESDEPISETSSRFLDITEDKDYLKDYEYSLYKAAEENVLIECKTKNWTIIRPYKTYSEDRLQLGVFEKEQWADRAIRGKKVVFLKDSMDKLTSLTHHTDAAKIIGLIINQREPNGKIYQIANPEQHSWQDIINIYAAVFAENGIDFNVVLTEDYYGLSEMLHNRYRMKYDGFINRVFSDKTIQELFGEFNWISVKTGLQDCLSAYIEKRRGDNIIVDYSVEGFFDRLTGETEAITTIPGWKNKTKYLLYRYLPQGILFKLRKRKSM